MLRKIKDFYSEFKPAILFLVRLCVTYFVLSVLYGFWLDNYKTTPDPATYSVANQVVFILRFFYDNVRTEVLEGANSVRIWINEQPGIEVYEGCNGVAIFYLFFSFLVGYWGGVKRLAIFTIAGIIIIHLGNLLRLVLLAWLALNNSEAFHFTHKYLFTISIYAVVFILWYFWIAKINSSKKTTETVTDNGAA